MKKKYLIVICGPTASGKTALSIDIAKHFGAEILSCDSRQFFKEMTIGTAKPTAEEQAAMPHHFVNSHSVEEEYTMGRFERDALQFLENYYKEKQFAVLVGGSGQYIKALCEGMDNIPKVAAKFREELNQLFEQEGIEPLQRELKEKDPIYYEAVDQQNPQRLIRALEICRGTGEAYSSFRTQQKKKRFFEPIYVGIHWEREPLYQRINHRVDLMMQAGLLEEVKGLLAYRELNALQTVGYREIFEYIDGNCSLDEAVDLVKRNSRRYAKRQLTWFRKLEGLQWLAAGTPVERYIQEIEQQIAIREEA